MEGECHETLYPQVLCIQRDLERNVGFDPQGGSVPKDKGIALVREDFFFVNTAVRNVFEKFKRNSRTRIYDYCSSSERAEYNKEIVVLRERRKVGKRIFWKVRLQDGLTVIEVNEDNLVPLKPISKCKILYGGDNKWYPGGILSKHADGTSPVMLSLMIHLT